MKPHKLLIILTMSLVGCERPGDGQESEKSKIEWSILQNLESENRGIKISDIEITESGGYRILSLMAHDDLTRLWIMLDATKPPFYKQMPANFNYDISEAEMDKILDDGKPISSTYQALKSHLRDQSAEQDAAPNH